MSDSNDFLEMSSTQTNFIATNSVLIGGSQRRVAKIMIYKRSWIQNNYFGPLENIAGIFQDGHLMHDCCHNLSMHAHI